MTDTIFDKPMRAQVSVNFCSPAHYTLTVFAGARTLTNNSGSRPGLCVEPENTDSAFSRITVTMNLNDDK